jgi:hypothetical protein
VVTAPSVHPVTRRCELRSGWAADGHETPDSFSARAIRATECPAEALSKDPPDHVPSLRVGVQAMGAAAPGGMGLVRMRSGIAQPVPERRPPR